MYATHHHDLFYTTVKYHQNIPNGIQVIERTRKCLRMDGRPEGRTDARHIAISPEPFGRGIKKGLIIQYLQKLAIGQHWRAVQSRDPGTCKTHSVEKICI